MAALFLASGPAGAAAQETPRARPVHTYSIVARDAATGELGVAVQSHWFNVGVLVPWVEAGVGAVATQSFVEASYGPLGLSLMRAGKSAPEALKALLAADDKREVRQVAMIDAQGRVATHTGKECIAEAGHIAGNNFSVQANLMEKSTVWKAMAGEFERTRGALADRLMAALEAAEREGGDIRGRQSAAIVVVTGKPSGIPWRDRVMDLRVDDHPAPLAELKRLLAVHRAYEHMNRGDDCLAAKDFACAAKQYSAAAVLQPANMEILFWGAVGLAATNRLEESPPIFRKVFAAEPLWREVVRRLPAAGQLPAKAAERIVVLR